MTTPVFRAEDLRCLIGSAPILNGVSFELDSAEGIIVAGRSGCGKTTLLEICAGLRPSQTGKIFWEGKSAAEMTREQLSQARRRTGFVFQKHALIHNFTIFDNIALPLRYHTAMGENDIQAKVRQLMEELGLFDVDRKFPNELSMRQAKCASLARALVMDPCILFADEPTAGVDPYTETCITNVLNQVLSEKKTTIIMICNEVRTMRGMHCPVKILDNGKLLGLHDAPASADEYSLDLLKTLQENL
jgi:phospholipid/cholesterol/gamma-HCH transport system ATP-binding protein